MRKIVTIFCMVMILLFSNSPAIFAADNQNMSVTILSPKSVKGIAGLEQTIKAEVKNETDRPIDDVMIYITMADMNKHMTVNLEDYNADKPVVIGTIAAGETKIVELPVRLVYVSDFYLYTTVVSSTSSQIVSSTAIPIEIIGNTMINKTMVQIISFVTPIVVLLLVLALTVRFRRLKY